jgi:nicotinate phosphoribosyltransferase
MTSPLLTDLYQLNMVQTYFEENKTAPAVFEFFVRHLPPGRNFLIAAGLQQAVEFLEALSFSDEDCAWLGQTGRFSSAFIDRLRHLRFTGAVDAMPEGTPFFPDEPILRVIAPLPEAQIVETRLINILHFQSLIASKAARIVLAAAGKQLVDFGLRRAHGSDAGVMAARAAYLAGFTGTATVIAQKAFGIPLFGTMAHSFVQAYDSEIEAFRAFAHSHPKGVVLLIDTYDTEAAARATVQIASEFFEAGIEITGVRLDSGDLLGLSRSVRNILDDGGLAKTTIFASGGLDEWEIRRLVAAGAPIDGFGIGTSLTTSADAPALDCAYKLQEYAGIARRKQSAGKATWPGRKQVWRRSGPDGLSTGDVVSTEDDRHSGEMLLRPIMRDGKRVTGALPALSEIRERTTRQFRQLPPALQSLEPGSAFPVTIAPRLEQLAVEVDRRLAARAEG